MNMILIFHIGSAYKDSEEEKEVTAWGNGGRLGEKQFRLCPAVGKKYICFSGHVFRLFFRFVTLKKCTNISMCL